MVPVIGVLSDKKAFIPTPNAAEVEAIFDAPLEMFLKVSIPSSSNSWVLLEHTRFDLKYFLTTQFCIEHRTRIEEQRRRNGGDTTTYYISLILKQMTRSLSYGL